jgi:N-glycosylase/DNA lyase
LDGQPLSLDQTLNCGQAFRWRRLGVESWVGVAGGTHWRLWLADDALNATATPRLGMQEEERFLRSYFRYELDVRAIQEAVAAAHPAAAVAVQQFAGLRILRQDPLETLLTFTIATATNVPRVTRNVREICARFGRPIASVDGQEVRDFPTPAALLAAPVDELFGPCNLAYRARSIQAVARVLAARDPNWASALATAPYPDAHRALDELPFFGPKVSDCVCLFGLGFDQAVPVDVHVWAIAHELFGEDIPTRSLTPSTYQKIGARFRDIFGHYAGWAQQYLFCARRAIPIRERFRPV